MRFPYGSIQTAYHYKENPPVPIWRQKPCECIGKMPYLRLTIRLAIGKGKPISCHFSAIGVRVGVCLPMLYQCIYKV